MVRRKSRFIWIPIALCILIAVLNYFYKLDILRKDMTEELARRRAAI